MSRLFAIGDIHGSLNLLSTLMDAIDPTDEDTLIFLGDMIDRGPDSKGVIDCIMALEQRCQVIALQGNHEEMMLDSLSSLEHARFWLRFGGKQALKSFGLEPSVEGCQQLPQTYIHWLQSLSRYCVLDDFIFCHAAADPALPIEDQTTSLRWRFLNKQDARHISGKTIICGHSEQKSGNIWQQEGLICIDTYAHGGGNLTALEVLSKDTFKVWQVNHDLEVAITDTTSRLF